MEHTGLFSDVLDKHICQARRYLLREQLLGAHASRRLINCFYSLIAHHCKLDVAVLELKCSDEVRACRVLSFNASPAARM